MKACWWIQTENAGFSRTTAFLNSSLVDSL